MKKNNASAVRKNADRHYEEIRGLNKGLLAPRGRGRKREVAREEATRMADVAKALGDPIRLQLVDVLRENAGRVCVCELVPLFDISQSTLSHHLRKLREAGIVDSERKGLWAFYYVRPGALDERARWLGPA